MAERSRKFTAAKAVLGVMQYARMAMGLCQRAISAHSRENVANIPLESESGISIRLERRNTDTQRIFQNDGCNTADTRHEGHSPQYYKMLV